MPWLAILLSALGLIPFVACGLAALGPDLDTASRMLEALIGYAAVVLAFVGGIHWGFVLQSGQYQGSVPRVRLIVAILPLLVGWISLVLPLVVAPSVSLVLLIIAYIATVLAEHEAGRRNLLPPRYLLVRWGFTAVAVAMLVTVLTLRLVGLTIRF
jgi:Protein of unknown function (DUF3429)